MAHYCFTTTRQRSVTQLQKKNPMEIRCKKAHRIKSTQTNTMFTFAWYCRDAFCFIAMSSVWDFFFKASTQSLFKCALSGSSSDTKKPVITKLRYRNGTKYNWKAEKYDC